MCLNKYSSAYSPKREYGAGPGWAQQEDATPVPKLRDLFGDTCGFGFHEDFEGIVADQARWLLWRVEELWRRMAGTLAVDGRVEACGVYSVAVEKAQVLAQVMFRRVEVNICVLSCQGRNPHYAGNVCAAGFGIEEGPPLGVTTAEATLTNLMEWFKEI